MQQLLLFIHILACIAIIFMVLIQHGKGADMGVAFGSGSSNSFFGAQGSSAFLVKITTACAIIFFSTSLLLGHQNQAYLKEMEKQSSKNKHGPNKQKK
jgi:preprotein translocase subunit SecG